MVILPITFYITSHDKDETLEFIGFKRKTGKHTTKKASHTTRETSGNSGENRKRERDRDKERDDDRDRDRDEDDEETAKTDKRKYEMLKRLKQNKEKK